MDPLTEQEMQQIVNTLMQQKASAEYANIEYQVRLNTAYERIAALEAAAPAPESGGGDGA